MHSEKYVLRIVHSVDVVDENAELTYWIRHQVNLLLNDVDNSLNDLKQVLLANPNHSGAFLARARILAYIGSYRDALNDIERCLLLNPQSEILLMEKARLHEVLDVTITCHLDD